MDKEDFVMCVKETTASKESSSKDSKLPVVVKNIKTDVTMGLKTIGKSFDDAEKILKDDGYSDAAVKDYIDRTKETIEREKKKKTHATDGDDDNKEVKKTAIVDTGTTTSTDTGTTSTTTTTDTEISKDISGAGGTSVTAASIYTRDPEEAISDQERLAQAELRRQREARAVSKASRLRTKLEGTQKFGPQGRRGGRGRRSLMTGSRGGIGYYSRFK
jgi:hypothetical protein